MTEEVKAISKAKRGHPQKAKKLLLDSTDLSQIPVEKISEEEAEELERLSRETDEDGTSWESLRQKMKHVAIDSDIFNHQMKPIN